MPGRSGSTRPARDLGQQGRAGLDHPSLGRGGVGPGLDQLGLLSARAVWTASSRCRMRCREAAVRRSGAPPPVGSGQAARRAGVAGRALCAGQRRASTTRGTRSGQKEGSMRDGARAPHAPVDGGPHLFPAGSPWICAGRHPGARTLWPQGSFPRRRGPGSARGAIGCSPARRCPGPGCEATSKGAGPPDSEDFCGAPNVARPAGEGPPSPGRHRCRARVPHRQCNGRMGSMRTGWARGGPPVSTTAPPFALLEQSEISCGSSGWPFAGPTRWRSSRR